MKGLILLACFFIPFAFAGIKCNTNIRTVHFNFLEADKASKEWYTPYSSHFINQTNFCSTSYYKIKMPYEKRGLEINATLKKKDLNNLENLRYGPGKKPWIEMNNYFEEDPKIPGISHWTTKVGPFTIKTDQRVFAVSPNYDWWATYYCAPGHGDLKKPFTEGIDIRSTKFPLDPLIVERIKKIAIQAGVNPKLVEKIKASAYKGCEVKGWKGERIIVR